MYHVKKIKELKLSLISNFRLVLNVICFFLVNTYPPVKMEQTECSEMTFAYKLQMPGNYPEESIQRS